MNLFHPANHVCSSDSQMLQIAPRKRWPQNSGEKSREHNDRVSQSAISRESAGEVRIVLW